ncbi:hypothetical protein BGZ88_003518, partial [Linnemannia elongata]
AEIQSFPPRKKLNSISHSALSRNLDQEKQMQLDLNNHSSFKCPSTGYKIRDCSKNTNSGYLRRTMRCRS